MTWHRLTHRHKLCNQTKNMNVTQTTEDDYSLPNDDQSPVVWCDVWCAHNLSSLRI